MTSTNMKPKDKLIPSDEEEDDDEDDDEGDGD